MLLLERLSRLQNSNTSLLFWNLFTGLKFLNELNIKSFLSLTKFSILLRPSYLYDLISIQPPHGHNTRSSPYVTLIKPSSSLKVTHRSFWHASPHLWNQLPNFHPLSATFIWTCRFNLLHTAITFHHFFSVSLWAQNLPFQKIISSTLVCFCLSDWSHGSRLFTGLICSSVLCFSSIFYVLVIPKCGRLSWQLVNF